MGTGGKIKGKETFAVAEEINFGFQAADHEFGDGKNVPKLLAQGNGIYHLKLGGKNWKITIEEIK